MGQPFLRLLLAGLIAFKAFDAFFATALTIAYRLKATGAAEALGQLTPGDDYARLVPLMDAVPVWLHGLWVLAGVLYLAAMLGVVRPRRWTYIPALAAVGVEVVARLVERPIIDATGVVVNPDPSVIATVVIPYVIPLLLVLLAWWVGHRTSAPTAAPR